MWTSLGRHEDKTGVHCCEGHILGGSWPAKTAEDAFEGDGVGVCLLESARPPSAIEEFSNNIRS